MKVCLDGQPLLGNLSGIGRYTLNLYNCLINNPDINVTLGFNRILKKISALPMGVNSKHVVNQRYPYKVIRRLMRPNFFYRFPYDYNLKEAFDIFHGTNFTYMPIKRRRNIITIHDLAFMKFPETTSKQIYRHHMKWVPYCAKNADHIITISESTKVDVVDLLSIHPDKITVVPLAAEEHFKPLTKKEYAYIFDKYELPERYILFVGTIEARKNVLTLVKAFHLIKKAHDIEYKLVVVGARGWRTSSLYDYIQEHHLQNDIVFMGYVEDSDLTAIYNGARMLVMPSWYEGFGLPLVEAMKCGVPVIGSNTSAIPEVIGPNGLMCNPNVPEDWAEQISMLLSNDTAHRAWSDYSYQQSGNFSWESTAEETVNLYNRLL